MSWTKAEYSAPDYRAGIPERLTNPPPRTAPVLLAVEGPLSTGLAVFPIIAVWSDDGFVDVFDRPIPRLHKVAAYCFVPHAPRAPEAA